MNTSNGDPEFNQILKKIGLNDDPVTREITFYGVCILVRFAIATLVLLNYKKKWLPYLVLILAAFACINLWRNLDGSQWWSRRFQFIMALLLVLYSILLIVDSRSNPIILPILLYISLFGGLVQSLFINFV